MKRIILLIVTIALPAMAVLSYQARRTGAAETFKLAVKLNSSGPTAPSPTPTPSDVVVIGPQQGGKLDCEFELAMLTLPCRKWQYNHIKSAPNVTVAQDQAAYKALFPDNCYEDPTGKFGFGCYWGSAQSACKALMEENNKFTNNKYKNPKAIVVSGDYYDCFLDASEPGGWPHQKYGPIRFDLAPPEPHCSDAVSGPYRECADDFVFCGVPDTKGQPGFEFTKTQRDTIKKTNSANNGNHYLSDGRGFRYPKPDKQKCIGKEETTPNGRKMCVEPNFVDGVDPALNSPQIHHIVPRRDRTGCNCGANSMKNAAVISKQLNDVLKNNPTAEILHSWLKATPTYNCAIKNVPKPPGNNSGKKS